MMSWRRRVETPVGGPVSSVHGRHTGVSAPALLTEHGLGTCTGCRAGCQMLASSSRPLVSLSIATPLLRRAAATIGIAQRRSARRVACGGSGPPSRWPHGRRVCVEEEVCVESSSLRKNFESVSQTSVNGTEIDATRALRDRTLKVRPSPLSDAQKALAGSFTGALPRWSLFRNRVH